MMLEGFFSSIFQGLILAPAMATGPIDADGSIARHELGVDPLAVRPP